MRVCVCVLANGSAFSGQLQFSGLASLETSRTDIGDRVFGESTIFVRFDVAYGAPAPREGVQPEEGGTLLGWGYIRMLP